MSQIIDIADLDCVYLSYDEPRKEETWIKIQNMVPWAQRVDGIKGSDAAHKAAADASTTDRFVLIDGDNIPDTEFFNLQLALDDNNKDCVFRWKARNTINGLMYGNGGLSCWTKEFVYAMKTHENTDGSEANDVEFCFYPNYWAMHDCYSTTYPNATPFQAWRAGFREGVKMCLNRGKRPTLQEFENKVVSRNYDHLCIWQTVGADVDNGFWSIYGARLGTWMTMLNKEWDHRQVQDFDTLAELWKEFANDTPDHCTSMGNQLRQKLSLPIVDMDSEESKFFKHHYKSVFRNKGVMERE
jgi:hypothetical protein